MKSILIITKSAQTTSGIGRYSLEMVRALASLGYTPTVLVERDTDDASLPSGVILRKVLFPANSLLHMVLNLGIVRYHARQHAIVHAFEGWPFVVYGHAAVLGTRRRLFMTAHGTYAVAPLRYPLKRLFLGYAYHRATRICCVSRYTQKRLLELFPLANTTVIFSAASPREVLSQDDEEQMLRAYPQLKTRRPVFLTVGEIKERKGQLDSLTALALLKEDCPDFLYVLIGSGRRIGYINLIRAFAKEQGLEENILLITDSRDDRVPSFFYQRSDVFLLNSNNDQDHFEGFGLVILEAGQSGTPSIGSRDCGIEDAIRDGYSGLLANQRAHQEIAEKARELLDARLVYSERAREVAHEFTWEKTAAAYVTEYEV